jgi:hypothetical protein
MKDLTAVMVFEGACPGTVTITTSRALRLKPKMMVEFVAYVDDPIIPCSCLLKCIEPLQSPLVHPALTPYPSATNFLRA